MKLYEINNAILECVDMETGEVIDPEKLTALEMIFEDKVEGVVLACKNLNADIEALEAEKKNFEARIKTAKNRLDGYKGWLKVALNGEKFSTPKCSVSYHRSKKVNVVDMNKLLEFDVTGEYIKIAEPEARKTVIKKAIDSGIDIPGCVIEEDVSVVLK